jgi:hypothetical protein
MQCEFTIFDASVREDRRKWTEVWNSWAGREVFAHPGYVSLYAVSTGTRACCASLSGKAGSVLYPFLLRDLTMEAFWLPSLGRAVDIVSPYGYAGAYSWGGTETDELAAVFWAEFNAWAERQNVVSEFVRLSLFPETLLAYPGVTDERLDNVIRRLDLEEGALWMDLQHKVRKNVKKARRNGVSVEEDPTGARLDEFLRIYESTMDRRGASSGYYFGRDYFERMHESLSGQFTYFHAVHEGKIVSSELVLLSADNAYSFLGGTDPDSFGVRPNDLLKYEIIRWAASAGKKRFVLGGGYERGDGIYRYKLAFAPGGATPYRVGRRILNEQAYEALTRNRFDRDPRRATAEGPHGYFPEYRAP